MKLIVEESETQAETEIIIRCSRMNDQIKQLMELVRSMSLTLKGKKDGCSYQIPLERIQYIEAVDDTTYLYCEDAVYECDQKLYELQQRLQNSSCVRISKSCIVNTSCLIHVRPLFDGKFIATTISQEELIINRHYVKAFKEAFGL